MVYQVWVDDMCYYTVKTLWEAKRKQELYERVFSWATVRIYSREIRKREHASQWMEIQSHTHRQGDQ